MLHLTQAILKINNLYVLENGTKKFNDYFDIYVLDEWTETYLDAEPTDAIQSLKEILNLKDEFNHISENFNIVCLETILSSLIESGYKGSEELRKDALLSQYIHI